MQPDWDEMSDDDKAMAEWEARYKILADQGHTPCVVALCHRRGTWLSSFGWTLAESTWICFPCAVKQEQEQEQRPE